MKIKSGVKSKLGIVSLACLLATTAAVAAPVKILTLREAILLALRYNPTIQNSELDRITQKFGLSVAKNAFELQYALTTSAGYQRSATPAGHSSSQAYGVNPSASIKTNYNGQVAVAMANNFDGRYYNPGATLAITQPLLQGFGSEIALTPLRNAYDQELINRLNLKNILISVVTQVIQDYRQVQSSKLTLKNAQMTLAQSQQTLRQGQAKVAAGVMAGSENIQFKANVASNQVNVLQAQNSVQQALRMLLTDLGMDPTTAIAVPDSLDLAIPSLPTAKAAIEQALANDASYQTALINHRIDERSLLVAQDNVRPDLTLTASATRGGGAGGGVNAGLASLSNGQNHAENISLNLTVPIDDMSAKQAVVQAKVNLQKDDITLKQRRQAIEGNILTSLANLDIQRQQLVQAQQALSFAQQNLTNAYKKLSLGRISALDVTNTQNNLSNAQQSLITTEISYLNQITLLQQVLGNTLTVWNIKIRY